MLPINDEIPPGSGVAVLVEGGPAVVKHQRYLGIRGRGQLHLKVQRLSQVPHHWIVLLLVERVIRDVWITEQDNRGSILEARGQVEILNLCTLTLSESHSEH